jgi:hypothetical protein
MVLLKLEVLTHSSEVFVACPVDVSYVNAVDGDRTGAAVQFAHVFPFAVSLIEAM